MPIDLPLSQSTSVNYDLFLALSAMNADQDRLDFEAKKLQSSVKDKSLLISERGALADRIAPGLLKSLVTLSDNKL